MGRAMRLIRRGLAAVALGVVLLALAAFATARRADPALYPPAPTEAAIPVLLVDHGYHVGLIVPRARLAEAAGTLGLGALIAVGQRFAAFDWLEIGWGEEVFYRHAPTAGDVTVAMALKSLFGSDNRSVLHIVGIGGEPAAVYRPADLVGLALSARGFERALRGIEASFAHDAGGAPVDLGPGLYGPSLFYRAVGRYHLLNVCNHWIGARLAEAGLPSSYVASTLHGPLLWDLRWRAGARVGGGP